MHDDREGLVKRSAELDTREGGLPALIASSPMANHKRRRPQQRRAGCLLCKPQKLPALKKAERRRDRRNALTHELRATLESSR
jgi:hypothetical protein